MASDLPARLRELHASKKPQGGVHGQMMGCEPYRLVASGNAFEWLIEAAEHIEKMEAAFAHPLSNPNLIARIAELESPLTSTQAAIRKEINQRLLGIAAAIEGTMDNTNVDLYTPAQVLALIVNAVKWAPSQSDRGAE